MKRLVLLVVVIALALAAVGCKSTSDHLSTIKDAGKIVVGTSADYILHHRRFLHGTGKLHR